MIVWENTDGRHKCTREQAVQLAKDAAKAMDQEYPSDEAAMEDFKIINCAWEE